VLSPACKDKLKNYLYRIRVAKPYIQSKTENSQSTVYTTLSHTLSA